MAAATRVTVTWADRFGNSARVVFHLAAGIVDPSDAAVIAVVNLLKYFTKCVGLTIEISQVDNLVDTPGTTAYANVEDKMITTFLDEASGPHNWKIPGIKTTLLETDHETLDKTNATVIAWYGAVLTNAVGPNGEPLSSFSGGHRSINRRMSKVSQ